MADSLLLTIETFGWEPIFAEESAAHAFLVALSETWRRAPFDSMAYVILPDHAHLLVAYPPTPAVSTLVRRLKGRSSYAVRREYTGMNRPGSDGGSGYWISTRGWSVRFASNSSLSASTRLPASVEWH